MLAIQPNFAGQGQHLCTLKWLCITYSKVRFCRLYACSLQQLTDVQSNLIVRVGPVRNQSLVVYMQSEIRFQPCDCMTLMSMAVMPIAGYCEQYMPNSMHMSCE